MQQAIKISSAVLCGLIPAVLYSYATGPDPRYTGAPGDQACVACHTGTALNGGGGNVQVISSGGSSYTPGEQQMLTITITDANARVYGFQASARLDSDPANGQAGDFIAGSQQQVLCDNGRAKPSGGCASSAPVQFIEHNRPFGTNSINVTWNAPSTDVGPVTIYVAGNAANGNNNDTGDHIYTTKLQLTPSVPVTSTQPVISDGGVVSLPSFQPNNAGVSPGTWLQITGTNLAATTRTWQPEDFDGAQAPTSLDGVSVTVGGINGYVKSVSPTQVVVQVPDGIQIGAGVPLVLTNEQGQSDPFALQTADLAPAIAAPAKFVVNGKQYAAATFALEDPTLTYVGNAGSIQDVTMQPAKPGDIITFSGIGFGPVTPETAAGTLTTDGTALVNAPVVLIGDMQANVLYAGLTVNNVGMYQISVEVPGVPAGDWPVTVQVGGITIGQNLYITTTDQPAADPSPEEE